MKVFLSWSGETSHKVALVLRDWLPSVIQSVQPYVSSEDIDKGTRWSSDIATELESSTFGIICITKENLDAPWINFEAGALSKTIEKTYVCPFLFGLKKSEISSTSPLLQFQSTIYEKEDVEKLLLSVNSACQSEKLDDARLKKTFEVWWTSLKNELDSILTSCNNDSKTNEDKSKNYSNEYNNAILEEILELSRNQQKLLKSPEDLLPQGYLFHVFKKFGYFQIDHEVWMDLNDCIYRITDFIDSIEKNPNVELNSIDTIKILKSVIRPMKYLTRFQQDTLMRNISFDDIKRKRRIPPPPRQNIGNLDQKDISENLIL